MDRYIYMNMYTGELYRNIWHAVKTIIHDMIKFPGCRTFAMLQLKKGQW